MPTITDRTVAFSTRWFDVIAKCVDGDRSPYYVVRPFDYVTILATDVEGQFLLVKQFRPALEVHTIELPSGLIDGDESPETCARRELLEETGYQAERFEFLGAIVPDAGRMDNRQWCFAASGARPVVPPVPMEDGIELLRCSVEELASMIIDSRCNHSLHLATLMLAILKGRVALPSAATFPLRTRQNGQ